MSAINARGSRIANVFDGDMMLSGTCFMHAMTQCDGVYLRTFTENSCKHRAGPQ